MAAEGPGNFWTYKLCYNNYSRFQNFSLLLIKDKLESKSSHLYIILQSNNIIVSYR